MYNTYICEYIYSCYYVIITCTLVNCIKFSPLFFSRLIRISFSPSFFLSLSLTHTRTSFIRVYSQFHYTLALVLPLIRFGLPIISYLYCI